MVLHPPRWAGGPGLSCPQSRNRHRSVTTAPSVADLSPGRFGRVDRRPAIRRGVQEVLVLQRRADCSSVPARRLRRWVSDVAGLGYQLPPSTAPTSPWTGSPAGSPPRDGGCELPLSGTCEGHTDYERRLIASEPASNPQPAWSCCCTRPRTPSRTGISPRASTTSIAGSARPKQNPPPTCSPTCSTSNSTPARSATWPAGPRPTRPCSPQRQQCAARSQSRAAQLRAPRSVPVVLPRGSATKHCVERSPSSHAPWCGSYHPRP